MCHGSDLAHFVVLDTPVAMSAHDGHRERQHLVPRRVAVRSLLRSAALSVSLILAYYLLPLQPGTGAALTWLVGGLTLVVLVIASQVRAILNAKYPWLRTITVLAVGTPLLIVAFAATYFLIASSDPTSFSQPLDRTGALYFTVTVLATVGFGDIAPVTTIARVAAMVQMVLDIAVIGLAAKVLFGAADRAVRNRAAGKGADEEGGRPG
jgi:voltage-gated potassium channel